jgi:hypothetical protein
MSKRANLLERVRATAAEPDPDRFREPESPAPEHAPRQPAAMPPRPRKERVRKGRTAIPLGVSLFPAEHAQLDNLVQRLGRAGIPGANRSVVVREALQRLEEDTEKLSDDECAADFLRRAAKRRGA